MNLKLDDFLYDLPEDRIAKHPPKKRGDSKLLYYNKGGISHHSFRQVDELLPTDSLLVFNDTRVIPARIIMHKDTGARIEIFLLEPSLPSKVHEEVMNAQHTCQWKCMIGNAKKWKTHSTLILPELQIEAIRMSENEVQFKWESDITFSDLLTEIGKIPLPPYINREVEENDQERYQTVYSKMKGAVAAPTAGLHFTPEIITAIKGRGIATDFVTLHVSAGTFQPIKSDTISEHPMHNEQIWISKENITNLVHAKSIIAVGTTAMRTLESLYWYGAKLQSGSTPFSIDKKDPYQVPTVPKNQALENVLAEMTKKKLERIGGETEIFIYPGYEFKMCDGLITNYHLPGSTLILLIAAFVGADWRSIYDQALANDYRFLSYGDSSLLLP